MQPTITQTTRATGAAVLSMAACAGVLIAAEFMPVSVLSPLAAGLGVTEGQAGQANAVSGAFAVITSVFITTWGGNLNRKWVLAAVGGLLMLSSALIALATDVWALMGGRVFLGVAVGAFWSLSTATIMRLVPPADVPRALSIMYLGQAVAAAFAAPIATWAAAEFGWRAVFWALVPIAGAVVVWQAAAMPPMAGTGRKSFAALLGLLKRRYVALGLLGAMLSWGASAMLISYMRTYLEGVTRGDAGVVTLLFTVLGLAGFIGTWAGGQLAARHGQRALALPAGLMALVALGLVAAQTSLWAVAGFLVVFGAANTAMSIIWMMWLARNIDDAPELAGSLILPALQLAIMAGGMLGGALLDWGGVAATYLACAGVAVLAVVLVGTGKRMEKG